ncbi:PARI protein, partial [Hemiprocne comata]|nr:PARI protein [Hemiprocne comata]
RIAGGRILSTVKKHLIKGRSNGDPFCQAVEEVVEDLDLKIKNIIDSQHDVLTASTTGVSPARKSCCIVNTFILKQLQGISVVWLLVLKRICGLRTLTNLGMLEVHCNFTVYRNPSKEKAPQSKKSQSAFLMKLSRVFCMSTGKQSSIKSQFACTYKNELSEVKGQHFLSSSQIPTCIHPSSKQHLKAGCLTEGMNSCLDVPVLGTISENVHQTRSYTDMGKLTCQPRDKNSKKEQMDLNNDKVICDKESEPSLQKNAKRPKTSNNPQKELNSKIDGKRKHSKTASKNKLIAGQAKLTNFFRL